jgi:hypothetical protein
MVRRGMQQRRARAVLERAVDIGAAGGGKKVPGVRGLHSSTFQLNLSL